MLFVDRKDPWVNGRCLSIGVIRLALHCSCCGCGYVTGIVVAKGKCRDCDCAKSSESRLRRWDSIFWALTKLLDEICRPNDLLSWSVEADQSLALHRFYSIVSQCMSKRVCSVKRFAQHSWDCFYLSKYSFHIAATSIYLDDFAHGYELRVQAGNHLLTYL